jgi:hypothetical protein
MNNILEFPRIYSRRWIEKLVQAGWLSPNRWRDARAVEEATNRLREDSKNRLRDFSKERFDQDND